MYILSKEKGDLVSIERYCHHSSFIAIATTQTLTLQAELLINFYNTCNAALESLSSWSEYSHVEPVYEYLHPTHTNTHHGRNAHKHSHGIADCRSNNVVTAI